MSNESAEKTDSPAKQGLVSRWTPGTVAGKTALTTAVVLLLTLIAVWVYRRFGPDSVRLHHAISWGQMLAEFALVVIIPAVLYWGIRRWNQVIEGVYPDIDKAWQAGIDALQAQGIAVDDYPIFLILGSSSPDLERGLISALETQVFVDGIPCEPGIRHSLQWYACSDAIYLYCPGASCLGALLSKWSPASTSASLSRPQPIPQRRSVSDRAIGPAPAVSVAPAAPAKPTAPPAPAAPPMPAAAVKAEPAAPSSQPAAGKYLGTLQFGTEPVGEAPSSSPSAGQPFAAPTPRSAASAAVATAAVASPVATDAGSTQPSASRSNYGGTLMANQLPAPAAGGGLTNPEPTALAAGVERGVDQPSRPEASAYGSVKNTDSSAQPPAPPASQPAELSQPKRTQSGTTSGATSPLSQARRFASSKLALPATLDTSDQVPRLRYLSHLLRRVRQPRCGINGIVTLIPFELASASQLQISALAQSARNDVETVQQTLGIRSPVTAVLVGLEQDKGFTELVRRLQPELLSRRLGGRFDLRSRPTPDELNAHSDRLCDAFEDWVYRLFARDDALAQQRGNRKLYGLISRIRHDLKPRLRIVLGQAFGCEPTRESDDQQSDQSFFFSGCYFAASGAVTGQPAFVKGVLQDKLIEEQSQVQWTPAALRRHWWFRCCAIAGWIVSLLLFALLATKWAGWI